MNKALLLASAACIISFSSAANANMLKDLNPYVGADYVYSHADFKGGDRGLKKDYDSGAVNAGIQVGKYTSLEAFYQHSGTRKTHDEAGDKIKSNFQAYGLDMYGYLPLGCSKMDLLGSVGAANYKLKVKDSTGKYDKDRIGYRIGAGAQYRFTDHISARIMGRYSYIDSKALKSLTEVTAGLRYTF